MIYGLLGNPARPRGLLGMLLPEDEEQEPIPVPPGYPARINVPGLLGAPGSLAVGDASPKPGQEPPAMAGIVSPPANTERTGGGLAAALASIFAGQDDPTLTAAQNLAARRQGLVRAGLQTLMVSGAGQQRGLGAIAAGAVAGQETGTGARKAMTRQALEQEYGALAQGQIDLPRLRQMYALAVRLGDEDRMKSLGALIQTEMANQVHNRPVVVGEGSQLVDPATGRVIAGTPRPVSYSSASAGDRIVLFDPRNPEDRKEIPVGLSPSSDGWGAPVETDSGLVQVNPRTGEVRPVVAGDGTALRKPIPRHVRQAISTNRAYIANIDRTIAAVRARPQSVGILRGRVEALDQRIDPDGVPVRAQVADIGSAIRHDRSGASVTAGETPHLRPFIPSASDTPEATIQKLLQLRERAVLDTDGLAADYGLDEVRSGGGAPPARRAGGGAAADATITAVVPGGRVISVPGDPRDGGARTHQGIDVAAPRGAPIRVTRPGRVLRTNANDPRGGRTVTIRHDDGTEVTYAHLDAWGEGIRSGLRVEPGRVLGTVGNSGNARNTEPHAHIQARDKAGNHVDPREVLAPAAPPQDMQDRGANLLLNGRP